MDKCSEKEKAAGAASPPLSGPGRDGLRGLALVLAVVAVYMPVWWAGYIWDDDLVFKANPVVVGPLGLVEIWTTRAADICPLTLTTFWLEHALWGLTPLPYHLVTVLFHAAGAVVLWRVLCALRVPGAWLGAALWALHPVQVESVAWIAEMKNTESGLFFLLAILFYVRWLRAADSHERRGRGWNYGGTLLFAAMAMAAKSSTVILPVVLCLCAWWMEGRWQWRRLPALVPIFSMSLAAGLVSVWTQGAQVAGLDAPQLALSWPARLAMAGDAIWFYLGKLAWPHPLIAIYPRRQIDPDWWISYLPMAAAMGVAFLLRSTRARWGRPWFFAYAYFLVALLPVMGFVDLYFFQYTFVADHFQYLAGMGPLALAGAGLSLFAGRLVPSRPWSRTSLCAGVLLVTGLWSLGQARIYRNEETLWSYTLAVNPKCWAGYNNLGIAFSKTGRVDEAIAQFQKALEIYPHYQDAHTNLGGAFLQKGDADAAIAQFHATLDLNFKSVDAHYDLGNAFLQKGQADAAIREYRETLRISPGYKMANENLGNALLKEGRVDEAVAQFERSLDINSAQDHCNLGNALLQKGQVNAAITEYRRALAINPNAGEIHNNLGVAFFQQGRKADAIAQFQEALRVQPDCTDAQVNLAKVEAAARPPGESP